MADTSYQIFRDGGAYKVRITRLGTFIQEAEGFSSRADAESWIAQHQRIAIIDEQKERKNQLPQRIYVLSEPWGHPNTSIRALANSRPSLGSDGEACRHVVLDPTKQVRTSGRHKPQSRCSPALGLVNVPMRSPPRQISIRAKVLFSRSARATASPSVMHSTARLPSRRPLESSNRSR